MKKDWYVEIAFNTEKFYSEDLLRLFVESLRYMGILKPGTFNNDALKGFLIAPPAHITSPMARQAWAEQNTLRINTFGPNINAVVQEVTKP